MRILLFLLWVSFIIYAVFFAPGERGFDEKIFQELILMKSDEPLLIVVFSLLGIFPIAFISILLRADRYSTPAWPFAFGSFVLGGFALLPYFFTTSISPRRTNRTPAGWFYLLTNRFFLLAMLGLTLFLMVYGIARGSWSAYGDAFWNSHFVHVMSIDLVVMSILSMIAIRRDREQPYPFKFIPLIGLIPVAGLLFYTFAYAARPHRG